MAQANHGSPAVFRQWTTAQLVEALRAWDINYLTVSRRVEQASAVGRKTRRPPIEQLLHALARSDEPRVRDAVIGLLLLHPEITRDVVRVVSRARSQGEDELAEQLITLALASLYLQRIWWFQLSLAYGAFSALDEALFAPWRLARDLPPPSVGYGEAGLRRLAVYEQQRTGVAANVVGDWQNQARHVISQDWNSSSPEKRSADPAQVRKRQALRQQFMQEYIEREGAMSFRPDVAREDIERFLQQFGQLSQQPGRLYLAGGAALVHGGLRGEGATTVDIDLRLDVSDESAAESLIRQLMRQLGINVELASPADFIPLPADWEARSPFVGRYGNTDVFYFDYYTLALSKIARGTSRDLNDVALLAQNRLIQRKDLEAAYQQILPQLGHGRFFNIDPAKFAEQYAATLALLPDPN
ncbi:MAG TPA: DUF6036 family nucleotidyltransferase [Ktedonobacterales bacterium]|nr:DUF6036 family nucleotidyltransferase [Ktedonobacterales bacterium]